MDWTRLSYTIGGEVLRSLSFNSSNVPADVMPPAYPWSPLSYKNPEMGHLSIYLADGLSRLPVRYITKPHDNKSDPNIETGTYGLFSTCERQMRASIVKEGSRYIFFICNRSSKRVVAGYYRLAWKTEGVLHANKTDYAFAADLVHFVDPPIPISALPEPAFSAANTRFRLYKKIGTSETAAILAALNARTNVLADYLDEVDRLERFQKHYSGYRYVSWRQIEPFSWEVARRFLVRSDINHDIPNQSETGFWLCQNIDCGKFVSNQALLKSCPHCKSMGTLKPVSHDEIKV